MSAENIDRLIATTIMALKRPSNGIKQLEILLDDIGGKSLKKADIARTAYPSVKKVFDLNTRSEIMSHAKRMWDEEMRILQELAREQGRSLRAAWAAARQAKKGKTLQYRPHLAKDVSNAPFDSLTKQGNKLGDISELTPNQLGLLEELFGTTLNNTHIIYQYGRNVLQHVTLSDLFEAAIKRSDAAQKRVRDAQNLMRRVNDLKRIVKRAHIRVSGFRASGNIAEAEVLERAASTILVEADRLRNRATIAGRQAYKAVNRLFWDEIHKQNGLPEHLESLGFNFLRDGENGPRHSAAYISTMVDGKEKKLYLTIEHMVRISDDASHALNPKKMLLSFGDENSIQLEGIREFDPGFLKTLGFQGLPEVHIDWPE